jgi:predicted dehydrogenase
MQRRSFLVTAATAATASGWQGANDKVRVAIAGMGGRGNDILTETFAIDTLEVGAMVDPDGRRTESAAAKLLAKSGKRARLYSDARRAIDDKEIDAVVVSTCNHWHSLIGIWACQAGKDAYVEKPVSHNLFEGRKLVEAARKYKRLVQGGTQRRTWARYRKAIEVVHSGEIGEIYQANWFFPGTRDSIGFKDPASAPPAWLNWDSWLGPAPMQKYHENLVHYNWHWFWDFGNGELGNNGIHLVDVARWGINKGLPSRIYSTGGRFGYKDQAETPNTQTVTWTYPDGTSIVGQIRGLYTNEPMHWDFFGSKGHLHIFADGKHEVRMGREKTSTPGPVVANGGEEAHLRNFAEAVKSRDQSKLNAEIEQTYLSTGLCHLGNISYRLGREVKFDAAKERFIGDSAADAMLTRAYRKPYVVSDKV